MILCRDDLSKNARDLGIWETLVGMAGITDKIPEDVEFVEIEKTSKVRVSMKAEIGTVIHGTLRAEDLIPAFADELKFLDEKGYFASLVKEANKFKDWEDCEECEWLLERLEDALNEFAPEDCYFGSNDGDGTDFGFWKVYLY